MFRARLCLARGESAQAIPILQQVIGGTAIEVERERARYLLAHIIGGSEGAALREQLELKLRAHGVDAGAIFSAYFPELRERAGPPTQAPSVFLPPR